MQKIIVTGGMGYIGSHVVVELIDNGIVPVIVDNLSNSEVSVLDGIKAITGIQPDFEQVELSDWDATNRFFEKHQDAIGVIHFAALKAVNESVNKPLLYYKNNIVGLINVMQCMEDYGINDLIFSSSCTVYGEPDILPVTEGTPVKPAASPYGNTKQMGEEILFDYTKNGDKPMQVISLRYFNPIGAHDSTQIGELPRGVPNNLMPFITQTAAGLREQLNVYGDDYTTKDGTAVRDYIHVVDLAKAHVVAMKRLMDSAQEKPYEVFNIGTGQGYSVMDVIKSFEKVSGKKLNHKIAPRRAGDVMEIFADTSKAKDVLGWQTELSLDEMTASAWNWEKKIRNID